jgi:hypothetical protein
LDVAYNVLLDVGRVDEDLFIDDMAVATCKDGVETLQFIFPVFLLKPNI